MISSQPAGPLSSPLAPPQAPRRSFAPLHRDCSTTTPNTLIFVPSYQGTENINNVLIHMFQEVPNSYWEAMTSPDSEKWLKALTEEFEGLTEMGIWKLVDHPNNYKTIKCRWTYMLKSNGCYKARLVAKGYTQVQGIDYKEHFLQ